MIESNGGSCTASSCFRAEKLDLDGFAGGIQGGFNWQIDDWFSPGNALVLGIEADTTLTNWKDTINPPSTSDGISGKVDLLASVRLRAGIAFENILVFVTGGLALADAKYSAFGNCPGTGCVGSVNFNNLGGVFGGGMAWAFNDMVSVRAEGLYYIFNERHNTSNLYNEADTGDFVKFEDAFVARIGINFKLGQVMNGMPES